MALNGLKVVEFAGLAPSPFAGLVLAHNGASVTRIDRPSVPSNDVLCEGKRSIVLDTKNPAGLAITKRIIAQADVLIDSFRPGVLERLGLGPEVFHDSKGMKGLNDRLIYARLSGFPRESPYASMVGHDLSYIALSGVLSMLPGTSEKPSFPLNLLGDFAGGGLLCATGILLALIERGESGRGQVVDADMVSGTRYVSSFALIHAHPSSPYLSQPRGCNTLDGGASFYGIYTCADGKWMSLGCVDPPYFATFIDQFNVTLRINGIKSDWMPTHATQFIEDDWPKYIEDRFRALPRDYWADVFYGSDACAVPVLIPAEAASIDPSSSSRPAPHPRLSRTPAASLHTESSPSPPPTAMLTVLEPETHNDVILSELGISTEERDALVRAGALGPEPSSSVCKDCKAKL